MRSGIGSALPYSLPITFTEPSTYLVMKLRVFHVVVKHLFLLECTEVNSKENFYIGKFLHHVKKMNIVGTKTKNFTL